MGGTVGGHLRGGNGRRFPRVALLALALLALCGLGLLGLAHLAEARQAQPPPVPTAPVAVQVPVEVPIAPPAAIPASPSPQPSATPAPSPTPRPRRTAVPLQPGDLNVLLLGCDRPNPGGDWRTDTLVIVAIRPQAGFVALFSVPRDLWVDIPGYGYERINTADYRGEVTGWPGGGPGLVGATLERNLGIPVHAYVRVRLQGLVKIIDTLGGITVDVDRPYPGFAVGTQHMDGARALDYVRSRSTTNDLDRTRRQQQVLLAIRDAVLRPATFLQLPRLINTLSGTVDTDLDAGQVLRLADLARRLGPSAVRTRTFDTTMVTDWVTPGGAMVLLYDRARVEEVWAELTAP